MPHPFRLPLWPLAFGLWPLSAVAPSAAAQIPKRDTSAAAPPLITKQEAISLGVAALATLALAPSDQKIAAEFREPNFHASRDFRKTARDLALVGGPGPFWLGAALFASGHVSSAHGLADAGIHMTESVLVAASIAGTLKGLTGRTLPAVTPYESDDFAFGRGFRWKNGHYVSFPSGHTAAAFAAAASLTTEMNDWHPGSARYVGPALYGVAGMIGLARVYQNLHWASDIPLAVAIGLWSGRTVEAHTHRHSARVVDRILASSMITPINKKRTGISWSLPVQ